MPDAAASRKRQIALPQSHLQVRMRRAASARWRIRRIACLGAALEPCCVSALCAACGDGADLIRCRLGLDDSASHALWFPLPCSAGAAGHLWAQEPSNSRYPPRLLPRLGVQGR
jgi:hypothetical protein